MSLQTKRGQLQIFLILGVLLIMIIFVVDNLYWNILDAPTDSNIPIVTQYVESCLKEVASAGISLVSLHGGYYIDNETEPVFYFDNGLNTSPSKDFIELQIKGFIDINFDNCIQKIHELRSNGIIVSFDEIDSMAEIGQEDIFVYATFPMQISGVSKIEEKSNFFISIDSNFQALYDASQRYIEIQKLNRNSVLLSDINDISQDMNVSWEIEYEGNVVHYSILDANPPYADEPELFDFDKRLPKVFSFSVKYDWGYIE